MPAPELKQIANELRVSVLKMANVAGGGHIAGPLSSADLFAVLYFGGVLNFDPSNPWDESRDRLVLSCGHYAPVLYASLAKALFFEESRLATFGKMGGLPVHPERLSDNTSLPGIEASTGPLAQGMSVAVGVAKALKNKRNKARVFCVVSDGELQEGQAWEAVGLSVREKLDNLIWLVDANGVQIEHYVKDLAGELPILNKLEAWGCHTLEVDGNNPEKVKELLLNLKYQHGVPIAVVCKSVGGSGVTFMENNPDWHDGKLNAEQMKMALEELDV